MKNKQLIAPSVLAADFLHLQRDIELMNGSEADWLHIDIMDGRFVPNISFGMDITRAIHRVSEKPLDVHLMIEEPDRYLEAFRNAGAELITVHFEACPHMHRSLQTIRELGAKAGVALNPATHENTIEYVLDKVDLILVMTVNPGFGGQSFIGEMIPKIRSVRQMIGGRPIDLQVDGGITADFGKAAAAAGGEGLDRG